MRLPAALRAVMGGVGAHESTLACLPNLGQPPSRCAANPSRPTGSSRGASMAADLGRPAITSGPGTAANLPLGVRCVVGSPVIAPGVLSPFHRREWRPVAASESPGPPPPLFPSDALTGDNLEVVDEWQQIAPRSPPPGGSPPHKIGAGADQHRHFAIAIRTRVESSADTPTPSALGNQRR